MKKMLICCGALCMAFLLFCGSALAADVTITVTNNAVSVKKGETAGTYTVKRDSDVKDGQLYLALIQKVEDGAGAETAPLPTKDNVFYMDVKAAGGSSVSFTAFPKELEKGTYVVYLSDYDNGGAAKGVATLTVAGDGSGSGEKGMIGDVTGDKVVNANDLLSIISYMVNGTVIDETIADVTNDNVVNANDLLAIISYMTNGTEFARKN